MVIKCKYYEYSFYSYAKTTYIAKIKDNNLPSLHLFKKLGFIEIKKVPAFSEIHLEYKISAT